MVNNTNNNKDNNKSPSQRIKLPGIYRITCKENGKVYVGSSVDVTDRWKNHLIDLILNRHHNKDIQDDFHRYGYPSFTFEIITFVKDVSKLKEIEQSEIDKVFDRRLRYNKATACAKKGIGSKKATKKNNINNNNIDIINNEDISKPYKKTTANKKGKSKPILNSIDTQIY